MADRGPNVDPDNLGVVPLPPNPLYTPRPPAVVSGNAICWLLLLLALSKRRGR